MLARQPRDSLVSGLEDGRGVGVAVVHGLDELPGAVAAHHGHAIGVRS